MKYLDKLHSLNKTCIIFEKDSIVFHSTKRGVQPLIDFLSLNHSTKKNYILADKIIGRGAIILAKLIGIIEIHTPIISKDALELATKYNINCIYKTLVPFIENRDNSGRCPIESCVLGISDPDEGYIRIQIALVDLKKAT